MIPVLAFAVAAFVGNDACRPCHTNIVSRFETTPMARSTAPIRNGVPPGSFRHAASGNRYTIAEDGKVSIARNDNIEQQRFDYIIGSGAAGSSYLISRDRYLFQAPIAWYSQKKRWDASPGYQDDPRMAWDRPVDPSCLLCHASQLTHIYGTVNRYTEVPFQQGGVGCERCHGAGSEHVKNPATARMVLASKLSAERRDDICRQCHLMGEARIPRVGRAFGEYRAGERLGDYVAYFVFDDPNGPLLRTTSHVEKLKASRCKQISGEKMWCGSCHDIHGSSAERAASYRARCLSCHNTQDCNRGPGCVSCHMPKSQAIDAGHGAFTDHSIARRPVQLPPGPAPWRLRPFSAADAGDRELAYAYAQLYQRTRDERQKAEALRLAAQSGSK